MAKPSVVIKEALKVYGTNWRKGEELYMCHAIQSLPITGLEMHEACKGFQEIIETEHTNCLTVYLKRIDYKGRYKSLVNQYGHETPSTLKLRREWWAEHIEMLEAKGL